MKKFNKYESQENYAAASNRDRNTTSVSLVHGKAIVDGINVPIPIVRGLLRRGDHLVFDKTTGRRMVIRQAGFSLAQLDTDRFVDGKAVYYDDIDDRPFFVGIKSLGAKAFSQKSRCKITGFDLENGGTAKLTGNNFSCQFSYGAGASYTEIAAAMTAAMTGNYKIHYTFTALNDGIGVTSWPADLTVATGGLTRTWTKAIKADGTEVDGKVSWSTLADYCDLAETGYYAMNMKGTSETVRMHKAKYAEYVRTLSSATDFGDEATAFMNKATFNRCSDGTVGGDDGIALYNKYGGDWNAYADVCAGMRMINYDVPRLTAETLRTGEKATKELAAVKLTDFDGKLLDAFPAAAAAAAYGITTDGYATGFEPGNWHQTGVGELARIMRHATSGEFTIDPGDIINQAIVAGGGTTILGSTDHAICGSTIAGYQSAYLGNSGSLGQIRTRVNMVRVRVSIALEYDNH